MAGVLIFNGLITKHRLDVQLRDQESLAHTREVLFQLEQAESTLKDAESGQRGYLFTGENAYLVPYNRATQEIGPRIDSLSTLTAESPVQQKHLADLRSLASDKLNELAQTIALYRSGDVEQARALVLSDRGLLDMDRLRLVFAQMRGEEIRLEGIRNAAYRHSFRLTGLSLWLATLAAIVGLIALAVFILRQRTVREKHALELSAREEWFRTTLTSIGDAVIATDRSATVTFLNPVAEKLTGRSLREAVGKPIWEVFPIFNESTGEPAIDPVRRVIELRTVVGLADHTALRRKDGALLPIDDSAAPISDQNGILIGVVLVFRDISERRRAEDASRLLASIVESSDDGIVSKDMNGTVTSWNHGASKIFGYSADEMIGKSILTIYSPDRQDELQEILGRLKRGEHIEHYHAVRRCKDGKLIHVSLSVSPLRDANGEITGACKIVRDITAQVEAQKEITLQRERLSVTLKSIGDAVIATDTEGRVSFLNPIAEQLTGWPSNEAAGRPLTEVMHIVHEQSRQPVESPVMKVLRERTVVGFANRTLLIARNGKEFAIDDSAAPIRDAQGELIGVVLVFRDVTTERRSEEILRRTDKLAAAARLAATMAHEINNPLAAVVNLIYIAKITPGVPPALLKHLTTAEHELERVTHITRQALGFYRESSLPQSVDIATLVEAVLNFYSHKISAKNIAVQRSLDGCEPVVGIAGELRQAISNLIANAIDAVDRNGTILVSVQSNSTGKERSVELMVADDGPGIDDKNIERLFEPFFTTKKDVGTGLGLWATKAIVERHGGRIAVHPRHPGNGIRGAAFKIQLPCRPDSNGDRTSN
ncbi:MAG TPA: PAS domain S-box protein [Terracidiphilus sp.]|nr:PAS domain S-box protein [Terracidiphilus sp.]